MVTDHPAGDRTTRTAALGQWLRGVGGGLMPRTAIAVGIGATLAMNVYGGYWDGGAGGAVVAALYPVALVVSLETLVWVVRKYGQAWLPVRDHWEQWSGVATLATLAAITGIISYLHALTVLQRTGSHQWAVLHLGPLVPDQMILTGTLALVIAARAVAAKATPARTAPRTAARTAKVRKPKQTPVPDLSRREQAALARAEELNRIVNLVRNLDVVPGERALAAEYCGRNRRLARDVIAELEGAR